MEAAMAQPSDLSARDHKRTSLLGRITQFGLLMVMLVAASGAVSLWFAVRSAQDVQSMRQAADLAVQTSDIRSSWLRVVGTLDTFSITRPAEGAREQLDAALAELDRKLETLAATQIGLAATTAEENRAIAAELRGVSAEFANLVQEIYTLSEQGRWGAALQRRQVRLAELQNRLDELLARLDRNLQSELSARSAQIQRRQQIARFLSLSAVAIALLVALGIAWLSRRTLVRPLQSLIGEVQRITAGDFSSVTPMPRSDEIGELSRAVAWMAAELNRSYESLEARVQERTSELQRRTVQLQVAAQVARDIAATTNLDKLLVSAVELIRERFGFYHAGIFLNDARDEYAILRAATGKAGEEMLKREHKLAIHGGSGAVGLVGHAAESGEAQLARDVTLDPYHYKNPLLPETRSELALPLKAAERVIGVLDVQSQIPDAFDAESIAILQVMADQLAIAIQNARLLKEVRENLNELQSVYRRIERQEWTRLAQTLPVIGYEFDGVEVTPILANGGAGQAPQTTPMEAPEAHSQPAAGPLSIPLRVRGEVIGSLDVWPQDGELSEAEVYLLATISSRLSQVLESARLLQQAQRLAAREQQINYIATQMRSAVNIEAILQNTVRELGKALGTRRAVIQIGQIAEASRAGAADWADAAEVDVPAEEDHNNGGAEHGRA
jgi:nitrate/nitrite-specific signal transduction histidine kinase